MPDPDLRALADHLDHLAPPLDPDAVRSRGSSPVRRSPRLLVAAAAVLAVLAAGVGWQLVGGDDARDEVAAGQDAPVEGFPAGVLRLVALEVDGEAVPLAGVEATLQIEGGGLSGFVCGPFGGPVVVSPGRIELTSGLGRDDVGCDEPDAPVNLALEQLLGASPEWQIENERLVLRSDTTTAAFAFRQTGTDAAFPSGRLRLVSIVVDGEAVAVDVLPGEEATVYISPTEDFLSVSACNILSGSYALEGSTLSTFDEGVTQIGCDDGAQTLDDALFGLFDDEPTWERTLDGLVLRSATTVATFVNDTTAFPTEPLRLTSIEVNGVVMPLDGLLGGDASLAIGGGYLTARGGCNSYSNRVTVEPTQLLMGDQPVYTLVACDGPEQALDDALFGLLEADPTWFLRDLDGRIFVRSATTVATFSVDTSLPDGFPTGPLEVVALDIRGSAIELPGLPPTIEVSPDGATLTATIGCQRFDADVTVFDGLLDIEAGGLSSGLCPDRSLLPYERALPDLLLSDPTWSATTDGIVLSSGGLTATLTRGDDNDGGALVPVPTTTTTAPPTTTPPTTGPPPTVAADGSTLLIYLISPDATFMFDPSDYVPVTRPAVPGDATSRAEQAVRALFVGATEAEVDNGLRGFFADSDGLVRSVIVEPSGLAIVDLDPAFEAGGASTSTGGTVFTFSLGLTLFAVDGIEEIEVRLDSSCEGFTEFGQGGGCQRITRDALTGLG